MKLIANLVGICAVLLFVLSYQQKKRSGIVICNGISRALYVIQYLLLGAFEGAVLDVVGIVATVLAQTQDRGWVKKYRGAVIVGINTLIVVCGILLYENVFSLLPMFGVLLHTGAFWMKDEKKIRFVSFAGSPFWFVYNLITCAYGSAVGDMMTMVSIALAIYRYDIRKK